MDKILTIVIPSYNAEKYLDHCVPSMLDERIRDQIEILIVDDGSVDHTPEIADRYEREHAGTVRAIHKVNGGHGSAINAGIESALGKYYMIVDADDWLITDHLVYLVKILQENEADLFLTDAVKVNAEGATIGYERVGNLPNEKVLEIEEALPKVKNIEMHNYCVRTAILKEHDIKCHEHHFYVDNEFTMYSLFYVHTVMYVKMNLYQYLVGRKDQSISIRRRRENHTQYLDVEEYLENFYDAHCEEMKENKRVFYCRRIAFFVTGVYSILMSYKTKEKKMELMEYDERLRKEHPQIYAHNENLCVKLLRMSKFGLYDMAAWVYRTVNGI